jgi:AcrR family transcriptional regulator
MDVSEKIVQTADDLFTKLGLRSVTMDDIAKKLGISKKTIYLYFDDKDELVGAVVKKKMHWQLEEMRKIRLSSPNPVFEVLKLSEFIRSMVTDMHPSILYDLQKFFPKSYIQYQKHIDECFIETFSANIQQGISEGFYRKNINPEILAILRMAQIEMGFNPELFPPTKFKLQEIQVEFIVHFLYGICTLKGHQLINHYFNISDE